MEGKYETAEDENGVLQLGLCKSTREILYTLEKLMKKSALDHNLIKNSLIKASRIAVTFDDYRSLYLFSFFSVYPKIWPDSKWVDSLMETSLNHTRSENQLFVLLKDAALMGKQNISKKIRPKLETAAAAVL